MSKFQKIDLISKILEKYLIDEAMKDSERRFSYFKQNLSPSMDFMCMRKTYFNIKSSGPKSIPAKREDFSYSNLRALKLGNAIHEQLQELLGKAKILILNETPLKDENLKISARLDSVVEINGELYLVEIKSAKSYSIHLMEEEAAPDLQHLIQTQCYFHLLEVNKDNEIISNFLKGRQINKSIIYYECKNDQKPTEYLVYRDQQLIDQIKKWSNSVWTHVREDKIPRLVFESDAPECLYKCSSTYYEKCHGKPRPETKFEDKGIWGGSEAKKLNKDPKF